MDIKKYICFIALFGTVLAGCSKEEVNSSTDDTSTPILLSARIATSTETKTPATGHFPNKGKIAVIAAKHIAQTDWSDIHLDNKPAETTGQGSTYTFNWSPEGNGQSVPTYFWPYNPNEKLVFVAYAPTTLSHSPLDSKTSLHIQLKKDLEDVIYTKPTGAMNKDNAVNKTVDLGEFQHALTKVRIVVKAFDKKGNSVATEQFKVKAINIKTKATSATFDLTKSERANKEANSFETFTLLNTVTDLNTTEGITVEQNILPESENITYIGISLTDGVLDYGKNGDTSGSPSELGYTLSEFEKEEGSANLAFEAGKITTLTFKIIVTNVSNGDGDDSTIILKGNLKDWECQGNFEVGIE